MVATAPNQPTLWGLTPVQLHDRFWASRGVQAVRQGEPYDIVAGAELFLLTDPRSLALFELPNLVNILCWAKPQLLCVRLADKHEHGYGEQILTFESDRFLGFERIYHRADWRLARVALTRSRELALLWQSASDARSGWHQLRRHVPSSSRAAASEAGNVYDRSSPIDVAAFTRRLVQTWQRPNSTVQRARRVGSNAWADEQTIVDRAARFVGPVWVGSGRQIPVDASIVGPSILWDDPQSRPSSENVQWHQIEPTELTQRRAVAPPASSIYRKSKRIFDILFSGTALLLTLPVCLFVMLSIWLEDGRPFLFRHPRETRGGRTFDCIKFRSMRKNAEEIKAGLTLMNQADGPQFYMKHDPRLTRVGRFIRACNMDELPQFWNVLRGDMSVVGPRPSPAKENQFCPAWREARLSVRPGITGMWQVKRTRQPGLDFQEWIKYDIEYVEKASWRLDLSIILQTIQTLL